MTLELDQQQHDMLAEILRQDLKTLRVESARADSHDYREQLHARERVVESLLVQLCGAVPPNPTW